MKRRKGLKPRSDRRIAFEEELDLMTPLLAARSRGICEICGGRPATERHHRLRRSQGGRNELWNLLHLCEADHKMVHRYPALSYEKGWLIRRSQLFLGGWTA